MVNSNKSDAPYLDVRIFGRSDLAGPNLGQEPPVREISRAQPGERTQANYAHAIENLADWLWLEVAG